MAYRPNAARAVRSRFNYGPAPYPTPTPGETVWCVILGEPGDPLAAWADSYVATVKGESPPAFRRRVGTRVVWDRTRGREFHFRDQAHAERVAADARDEA